MHDIKGEWCEGELYTKAKEHNSAVIKAILFVAEGIQPSIKMFEIFLEILKSINACAVVF